jgi:hypothetical protein
MSYKCFCGLIEALNVPGRTTIWTFENPIGEAGSQIVGATLVPASQQHNNRPDEQDLIEQGALHADWKPAKRRRKDLDATWIQRHGKSYFGYKLSVNVDRAY